MYVIDQMIHHSTGKHYSIYLINLLLLLLFEHNSLIEFALNIRRFFDY